MKRFIALVAVALVVASCGTGEGGFDGEQGFTQGSEGQLRALAYAYQPNTSLTYGYSMGFGLDMETDFPGAGGFGETVGMEMDMAGTMTYDVSAGPSEGTVKLIMDMAVSDVSFSDFTVDGASIPEELAGFDEDPSALGIDVIPTTTVVIDAKGDVLEMTIGDLAVPSDFLNSFGGGFGDPTGMGLMGSILGPEFPDGDARVGAKWTTTDTQSFPGMGDINIVHSHEIVGEETVAGRNTIVIRTSTEVESISMAMEDLVEMLSDPSLTAAVSEEEAEAFELEVGMMEALDFDFEMSIDYDDITTTTWFDFENGVLVSTDGAVVATMDIRMDTPEGKGSMEMVMDMTLGMILTDDGAGV